MAIERITVDVPHIPFGPAGKPEMLADADYFDHAARNIYGGYAVGGHNVTAAVIDLLHNAAKALRAEHATREKRIDCPHWAPGTITLRAGCAACQAEPPAGSGGEHAHSSRKHRDNCAAGICDPLTIVPVPPAGSE